MKGSVKVWLVFSIVLAILHLGLVLLCYSAFTSSTSSTSALALLPLMILDAPVMFLSESLFSPLGQAAPLVQFGVLGTALWFVIPWLIGRLQGVLLPAAGPLAQCIVMLCVLPLLVLGFTVLSTVAVTLSLHDERPVELQGSLNEPQGTELHAEPVFTAGASQRRVTSLAIQPCLTDPEYRYGVGLPDGVQYLDRGFGARARVTIGGELLFNRIEVVADHEGCRLLGFRIFDPVVVHDNSGKVLWRYPAGPEQAERAAGIQDVRQGDVDGDGIMEFAVGYGYQQGIDLLSSEGRRLWTHPVAALGNFELVDVDSDGRAELLFTNANNSSGLTTLTTIAGDGQLLSRVEVVTTSSAFAVLPRASGEEGAVHLVLTEENAIKVVDLQGRERRRLAAPGCRPFGPMAAEQVRFRAGEAPYLAVQKRLHPDLLVLYVYDSDGNLVHQLAEATESQIDPFLAVIPDPDQRGDRLLAPDGQGRLLMYSRQGGAQ